MIYVEKFNNDYIGMTIPFSFREKNNLGISDGYINRMVATKIAGTASVTKLEFKKDSLIDSVP